MVLTSLIELLSIGSALPFLGVLTNPDRIYVSPFMQWLIKFLNIQSPSELILPLIIIFGALVIVSTTMRLLLLWFSNKLCFSIGADIGASIYSRTLNQPYSVQISRNSSELIDAISHKSNDVIYSTLLPILNIISSGFMLAIVLIVLLIVNFKIAMLTLSGVGILYALIIRFSHKNLYANSVIISNQTTLVVKLLQEAFGGIRDILINGSQGLYVSLYQKADLALKKARADNQFIGQSPRFILELMGMLLISLLAYSFSLKRDGIAIAIPILGTLALGIQRMLPIMQQAYISWSAMKGGQKSLQDAINFLDQPMPEQYNMYRSKPLEFNYKIEFKKISFSYSPKNKNILSDMNLVISKGDRIGIIGGTGSGKSTALDLLMGLLRPTVGFLTIDDRPLIEDEDFRQWQMNIAHVPQAIYLSDGTIAENIAYATGVDDIDISRVIEVAKIAQISSVIEGLPEQYDTLAGERGVKLSGGQRQRIGIARALYRGTSVLILDEATSALDSETEKAVMQEIERLRGDITVILVTHRRDTLKYCNRVIDLERL